MPYRIRSTRKGGEARPDSLQWCEFAMEESNTPGESVSQSVPVPASDLPQVSSHPHAHLTALMERVRAGNVPAFGELYDATSDVLHGLAMRILKVDCDAQEVVLDAYTRAWRLASDFDERRGSVLAWLTIMTRSLAIDRLRSNQSRGAKLNEALDERRSMASEAPGPEEATIEAERSAQVRRVLHELPQEQQEVLALAYFQGLSQSEIAAQLGIPLGTVKTRARLGMANMRDSLEELR